MKRTEAYLKLELLELEEHNDAVYQEGQLLKVLRFLKFHGADDELIEVIEYELEDNEQWISKDLLVSGNG